MIKKQFKLKRKHISKCESIKLLPKYHFRDQLKKQFNLNEVNSAKDFLMQINFDEDSLSREEEKFLDSLNQKVIIINQLRYLIVNC